LTSSSSTISVAAPAILASPAQFSGFSVAPLAHPVHDIREDLRHLRGPPAFDPITGDRISLIHQAGQPQEVDQAAVMDAETLQQRV
jgi:hypothetical protein